MEILFQSLVRLQILETMHSSWCSCDTSAFVASAFANSLLVWLHRWCLFGHDRNQKDFMNLWKMKTKIFRCLLSSSPRKNQTEKKVKKIWEFSKRFHLLLTTSNAVPYAIINLVLCVTRCGQNTVDVCFIWTSIGSWGKMLERVAHAMTPVRC